MTEAIPADQPIAEPEVFVHLRQARHALLHLHKVLLDAERAAYEGVHGTTTSGEMLRLVIGDPHFAWLHTISELVVRIDEMFDADQPATADDASALIDQIRGILKPSETGGEFARKYFAALQADPDAVLAHRDVTRALSPAE
jgi:hypothetical protein